MSHNDKEEKQYKLWRDSPKEVKKEMNKEIYKILKKQHKKVI